LGDLGVGGWALLIALRAVVPRCLVYGFAGMAARARLPRVG
jgi:hypothetical protein